MATGNHSNFGADCDVSQRLHAHVQRIYQRQAQHVATKVCGTGDKFSVSKNPLLKQQFQIDFISRAYFFISTYQGPKNLPIITPSFASAEWLWVKKFGDPIPTEKNPIFKSQTMWTI